MKEKECNFAMLNQQRMVTLTRNTNGLKNGTHYRNFARFLYRVNEKHSLTVFLN